MHSKSFLPTLSFILSVCACLLLGACVPNQEILPMPKGYAALDVTPVSSPHGYVIDPVRDDRIKRERDENAQDWAFASADIVNRLAGVLSARPSEVAIVPHQSFTPTSNSFDYGLRNALTSQGFIVSADQRAPTVLKFDAQITPNSRLQQDAFLDLSVRVSDNVRDFAEVKGTYRIRHQDVEIAKLPGFSAYPRPGISTKPERRVLNK